jgi:hypothetical protein
LKAKEYNNNPIRDYFFIVVNKTDPSDVILNSVKGLSVLTPNVNNLPFQVNWSRNREYVHDTISNKIQLFIQCLQKPRPSWKEVFMAEIRNLSN